MCACKNACVYKYHGEPQSRGTLTRKLYAEGQRFCSTCSVKYKQLEGLICPCCNSRVKSWARSRVRYEHVLVVRAK